MTKIDFEKFERDCGANETARKEGRSRDIIRDFRVIIDGEHRATLNRNYTGKGYMLDNMLHRPILRDKQERHTSYSRVEASSQADFMSVILRCLKDDLIPTIAEYERLQIIREAEKENRYIDSVEQATREWKERAGPKLFDAMTKVLQAYDRGHVRFDMPECPLVDAMRQAVEAATYVPGPRGDDE